MGCCSAGSNCAVETTCFNRAESASYTGNGAGRTRLWYEKTPASSCSHVTSCLIDTAVPTVLHPSAPRVYTQTVRTAAMRCYSVIPLPASTHSPTSHRKPSPPHQPPAARARLPPRPLQQARQRKPKPKLQLQHPLLSVQSLVALWVASVSLLRFLCAYDPQLTCRSGHRLDYTRIYLPLAAEAKARTAHGRQHRNCGLLLRAAVPLRPGGGPGQIQYDEAAISWQRDDISVRSLSRKLSSRQSTATRVWPLLSAAPVFCWISVTPALPAVGRLRSAVALSTSDSAAGSRVAC